MLISKIYRLYCIVGILLYVTLFTYWKNSLTFFNVINVLTFLSYVLILYICLRNDKLFYTNKNVVLITFLYSLFGVGIYHHLSEYYTGNTFLFSEIDARIYETMSNKLFKMRIDEWIPYLRRNKQWSFDDWGTPISMALMLNVVPSKLFINFCYVIMNAVIAYCLFSIGKNIMSKQYAFMATLSYTLSSYSIFFMGSGLKEIIMVFLVTTSIFMLYKYWKHKNILFLIIGSIFSFLILFFRVPVAIFVWVVYATLLYAGFKSNVIRVFAFLFFLLVFVVAFNVIQYSVDRYANGGDVTTSFKYTTTSIFQKLTLYAGALIGPFPQLLQVNQELSSKSLFGAGVLFKLMLFLPFWKGVIYSIRSKEYLVFPIFIFSIMEMIGLAFAFDGLELRKAMPHVPFFILGAFWFIDKYDADADDKIQQTPYYIMFRQEFNVSMIIVGLITIIWNTIRLV